MYLLPFNYFSGESRPGVGQSRVSVKQRELLLWVKRHGRRPIRLSDTSTEEKALEARVAKTLSNLRQGVEKACATNIAKEMDQVSEGGVYSESHKSL
jgi:hypothetical protein